MTATSNPSPTRLLDMIVEQASLQPEQPALWYQGMLTSYQTFLDAILSLAAALAASGSPGNRIAVLSPNTPDYAALLYAVPAAGQILVPLNTRLSPAEWIYQLTNSGASTLIVAPELAQKLRQHPEYGSLRARKLQVIETGEMLDTWLDSQPTGDGELPITDPDQSAWLLYTSGTTGRPKGAMLSQANLLAGLVSGAHGRPVLAGDYYLYPFPLFHVAAHNVLLQHQFGACVVLLESFQAEAVLACCRSLPITTMSLAPTMIAMLLDHPDFHFEDLARVRTIGYGASAIPADLLQRLLTNCSVGLCQGYGMTELSGSIAFLDETAHREALVSHPERLQSVGKLVPGVEVSLVPLAAQGAAQGMGEILIKAPQTMLGYWQQEEATRNTLVDGWLHTGDIGRFDDAGNLYIVDRKKDMIITGGENVASREVEDVIALHPCVGQVAVVGVPDPKWGEAVVAFIQLAPGVAADAEAISSHCRQHLAGYKTPKKLHFIAALPSNASGKVDKKALRQQAIDSQTDN